MKDYHIALGNWSHVCAEVSELLNRGYELAGNLVVLSCEDDGDGSKYVMYYQPLVGEKPESE